MTDEKTPAEQAEEMEVELEQFYKNNRCPATLPAWRDARCSCTIGHTGKHTAYATWRNRSDG